MSRLHSSVSLLILVALVGCSGPVPDGGVTGECQEAAHREEPYFTETMLPLFETHCTVCHSSQLRPGSGQGTRRGAPPYLNYDVFDGAVLGEVATWLRVADRTMPPMGRELTFEELETVLEADRWARECAEGLIKAPATVG